MKTTVVVVTIAVVLAATATAVLASGGGGGGSGLGSQFAWDLIPPSGYPPRDREGSCGTFLKLHGHDSYAIFGGRHLEEFYDDLWVLDLETKHWHLEPTLYYIRPPSREGCAMFTVKNAAGHTALRVFGGQDRIPFNDMWEYTFEQKTWRQISYSGPVIPPRLIHPAMTVFNESVLWVHGGHVLTYGSTNDFYEYHVKDNYWTYIKDTHPEVPPRSNHAILPDATDEYIFVVGGETEEHMARRRAGGAASELLDVWKFHIESRNWTHVNLTGDVPYQLTHHSLVLDEHEYMYIMTGYDHHAEHAATKVYRFDTTGATNEIVAYDLLTEGGQAVAPRRDSLVTLHNDLVFIFGGATDEDTTNEFWEMNTTSHRWIPIFNETVYPGERAYGACVGMFESLYLFGGESLHGAETELHNDLWEYQLEDLVWHRIIPAGTIPTPRKLATMVARGNALFLFGGYTALGAVNDLWEYRLLERAWHLKHVDDEILPPARFGHLAYVYDSSYVVVFGGEEDGFVLGDLWAYDIELSHWTPIVDYALDSAGNVQAHGFRRTFAQVSQYGGEVFIMGGESPAGTLGGFCRFPENPFDFPEHYDGETDCDTWIPHAEFRLGSATVTIPGGKILFYGGEFEGETSDRLLLVNVIDETYEEIQEAVPGTHPSPLAGQSFCFYQNKIYMYGGEPYLTLFQDEFWSLELAPLCTTPGTTNSSCFQCALGSEYDVASHHCKHCAVGYFRETFEDYCTPCPAGFFLDIEGASSRFQCLPCPAGTFSDVEGVGACQPCPPDRFCPAGSHVSLPLTAGAVTNEVYALHPEPIKDNLKTVTLVQHWVNFLLWIYIVIMCVAFAALMAFPQTQDKTAAFLIDNDMFSMDHEVEAQQTLTNRQTIVGGFLSILFLGLSLALLINVIVPGTINRESETSSLIPNLVWDTPLVTKQKDPNKDLAALGEHLRPKSDVVYSVALNSYTGPCAAVGGGCSLTIRVDFEHITFDDSVTTCALVFNEDLQVNVCNVTRTCVGCLIDHDHTSGKVAFRFTGANAFATSIGWYISASSGHRKQTSAIWGTEHSSSPNNFFRGTTANSAIFAQIYQTLYYDRAKGKVNSGWHVDYQSFALGSEVSVLDFHSHNGVNFDFEIRKADVTLQIDYAVQTPELFISSALTVTVGGLIGGFAVFMTYFERLFNYLGRRWVFIAGILAVEASIMAAQKEDADKAEAERLARINNKLAGSNSRHASTASNLASRTNVEMQQVADAPPPAAASGSGGSASSDV